MTTLQALIRKQGAVISPCGNYRWALSRVWDRQRPFLLIIGLNPSTADAEQDDPTIRRCVDFAKRWGFGRLLMANLFAWRSSKPVIMKRASEPIGKLNDLWLTKLAENRNCGMVLAAWGKDGKHLNRGARVLELLCPVHALKLNGDGSPAHPLYIPASTKPFLIP